jgi:hypothetical protein
VPLTYLDQNALIELGRKSRVPDFRSKLDSAIGSGSLTVVLPLFHLFETANTSKAENALALADFIDSLNPLWLRPDMQKIDVWQSFYNFAKIAYEVPARATDRTTALAGRDGAPGAYDVTARDFVKTLMEQPKHLQRLEAPTKGCLDGLKWTRKRSRDGRLGPENFKRVSERKMRANVPEETPEGLILGAQLREEFLQQADLGSIPTLAIENAISNHERFEHDYGDRNTLYDKFHLVYALPYVDEFVSRDKFFLRIYPVAKKTGHVRAALVRIDEFFGRLSRSLAACGECNPDEPS